MHIPASAPDTIGHYRTPVAAIGGRRIKHLASGMKIAYSSSLVTVKVAGICSLQLTDPIQLVPPAAPLHS
jgi:hypothetical protein